MLTNMMILKRILMSNCKMVVTTIFCISSSLKPYYTFSKQSVSIRKYMEQLRNQIITSHSKIKSDALVKMLHHLHFKSAQIQSGSMLSQHQIDKIVADLSSCVYQLNHQDITLLLQTISHFPKYTHYRRSNEFMRLLVKRLNAMQMIHLDNRYIFRFLNIMEKMKFPPMLIAKYVNIFLNKHKDRNSKNNPIPNTDYLKIFICILEMRFIPVEFVQKLYNQQIKKLNVRFPKDLCYLYYIYRTLENSLQGKINYFSNKLRLHQLVFNPYSDIVQPLQEQSSKDESPEQKEQRIKRMSETEKQKITKNSQKLITQMKNNINIQKLKQQICRHYDFQKYPMEVSTALLVQDIKQLQPTIRQFFIKNYKSLQVIQFISLLSSVSEDEKLQYYNQYIKVIWSQLQLGQKIALLTTNRQITNRNITKSQLLSIISQSPTISVKQFEALTVLIVQNIKQDEQLQIISAMESIVDKQINQQK